MRVSFFLFTDVQLWNDVGIQLYNLSKSSKFFGTWSSVVLSVIRLMWVRCQSAKVVYLKFYESFNKKLKAWYSNQWFVSALYYFYPIFKVEHLSWRWKSKLNASQFFQLEIIYCVLILMSMFHIDSLMGEFFTHLRLSLAARHAHIPFRTLQYCPDWDQIFKRVSSIYSLYLIYLQAKQR